MFRVAAVLLAFIVVGALLFVIQEKRESQSCGVLLSPITSTQNARETDFAAWHLYTAPDDSFRVFLPGLPQVVDRMIVDPNTKDLRDYTIYLAQQENGSIYMINVISFPKPEILSDTKLVYDTIIKYLLEADKTNKLIERKMIHYQGMEALDFEIANDSYITKGIAFIEGKAVYVLNIYALSTEYLSSEFHFFRNSFELLQHKAETVKTSKVSS